MQDLPLHPPDNGNAGRFHCAGSIHFHTYKLYLRDGGHIHPDKQFQKIEAFLYLTYSDYQQYCSLFRHLSDAERDTNILLASDFFCLQEMDPRTYKLSMILIFEQEFLLVSDTTLLELADTNQSLLRKMAVEAPGSFQHSLQVANLAEEAARVIGANLHLVRTGALYHDIGKIGNPKYLLKTSLMGSASHKLDPKESSKVIINHVKHGIVLAKNYRYLHL